MPMTSKEMAKLLKKNGFVKLRQRGSHAFYHNPKTNRSTTIPMHAKTLGKGIESAILKQAGLK